MLPDSGLLGVRIRGRTPTRPNIGHDCNINDCSAFLKTKVPEGQSSFPVSL